MLKTPSPPETPLQEQKSQGDAIRAPVYSCGGTILAHRRQMERYMPSGAAGNDEGLPVGEVGPWVHDKHARLQRYVQISSGVRGKFTGPGNAGTTYIDLYCGPGRARIRDSGEIVHGSAIVAANAARESGRPFGDIHIADTDGEAVHATAKRLRAFDPGARIHEYIGKAEVTAQQIVERVDQYGLHLAFLDPYNLGDLPFTVIRALGGLHHPDLLIHVSAMDLQRNWKQALRAKASHSFDVFAPRWREHVDLNQPGRAIPRAILEYWLGLIRKQGLQVFGEQLELVTGPRHQRLYWLALAAKHDRAGEFWEKIRHTDPQTGFRF